MKKFTYSASSIALALALLVQVAGQLIPLLTGEPWNAETKYLLRVIAFGTMMLAGSRLVIYLYQTYQSSRSRMMSLRSHETSVEEHTMRFAEDLYRQQGYFNQGSFYALNIALQYSVDENDPLVQDAMLALVEAGKLVPHQSSFGTMYSLPAARQLEMITKHDLSRKWQERGGDYLPNDPLVGEIRRVKSAVAAKQWQQMSL